MPLTFDDLPNVAERKGSLFLRSDHMNYSRATLNSNWHQAREAEPKDYDLSKDPKRDLCKATYKRIGDVTDGRLPETTYDSFANQINTRNEFLATNPHKPIIGLDTAAHANIERDTDSPKKGYGAVFPSHVPEYNTVHMSTTHKADYSPPFPYTPSPEKPADFPDYSSAYKRSQSQFVDTADYRRNGRNTWQDESGLYNNSDIKKKTPAYFQTNTIAQNLCKED